ncbi:MAG: cold shock-like protein CspB [Armatimonadaceae bacterium]
MLKGKVKWFSEEKGYGFIQVSPRRDVFVHYASIRKPNGEPLTIGEVVEFEWSGENPNPEDPNRPTR